jgi:RNase adaptor protein for sRNA GlmZ degradation
LGSRVFFSGNATAASTASTPNPTWIEEKRPKSGFSTSIILHSFTQKLSKSTVDEIVKIPWL